MSPPLNPRQRAFALEYAIDRSRNITQAAIRAGYSPKTAAQQGSRLLKNVQVQELVASVLDSAAENAGVTIERVITEFAKIAFYDVRKLVSFDGDRVTLTPSEDWPEDVAAAVAGIVVRRTRTGEDEVEDRIELKLSDRQKALGELLAYLKPADDGERGEGINVYVAVGTPPAASNGASGVHVAKALPKPKARIPQEGA